MTPLLPRAADVGMGVRRLLVLPLVLLLAGPADARSRPAVPCGSPKAETRAQSSVGRVYVKDHEVFACRKGVGRAHSLGEDLCSESCEGFAYAVLAGPYVAAVDEFTDKHDDSVGSFAITVRDLRDGSTRAAVRQPGGADARAFPREVVLDPRGNLAYAWVAYAPREGFGDPVASLSRGPGCGPELISQDLFRVDPRVRLRRGTLRFRTSAGPASAPLCAPPAA